jgi:hypothetical protein
LGRHHADLAVIVDINRDVRVGVLVSDDRVGDVVDEVRFSKQHPESRGEFACLPFHVRSLRQSQEGGSGAGHSKGFPPDRGRQGPGAFDIGGEVPAGRKHDHDLAGHKFARIRRLLRFTCGDRRRRDERNQKRKENQDMNRLACFHDHPFVRLLRMQV